MNSSAERYRHLFEYEKDSHGKVMAAFQTAPETVRSTEPFQKALDMMGHIAAARQLWLFRFGTIQERPADLFPRQVTLETVAADLETTHQAWSQYLAQLTDADLQNVLSYRSLAGDPYRRTIEDILTQLYGHSLYHRGQISIWMREAGAEPAPTDYLYWAREPEDSSV